MYNQSRREAHPVDAGNGAGVDRLLHFLIGVHALLHHARAPAVQPPYAGEHSPTCWKRACRHTAQQIARHL